MLVVGLSTYFDYIRLVHSKPGELKNNNLNNNNNLAMRFQYLFGRPVFLRVD